MLVYQRVPGTPMFGESYKDQESKCGNCLAEVFVLFQSLGNKMMECKIRCLGYEAEGGAANVQCHMVIIHG